MWKNLSPSKLQYLLENVDEDAIQAAYKRMPAGLVCIVSFDRFGFELTRSLYQYATANSSTPARPSQVCIPYEYSDMTGLLMARNQALPATHSSAASTPLPRSQPALALPQVSQDQSNAQSTLTHSITASPSSFPASSSTSVDELKELERILSDVSNTTENATASGGLWDILALSQVQPSGPAADYLPGPSQAATQHTAPPTATFLPPALTTGRPLKGLRASLAPRSPSSSVPGSLFAGQPARNAAKGWGTGVEQKDFGTKRAACNDGLTPISRASPTF